MSAPRGYFGVGVLGCKTEHNIGTLWRTAYAFGASYLFTIGRRYTPQHTDTTKAWRHVPLFNFQTFDHFHDALPREARLIGVELDDRALALNEIVHPPQAVYLLGAEDHGLPARVRAECWRIVQLPGERCLNVAVVGIDRPARPASRAAPAHCASALPRLPDRIPTPKEAPMSTAAIPVHVALVDASKTINPDELALVASALNEQVQADVAPAWKVRATVGHYAKAPAGTWRLELRDSIDAPGAAGYHSDHHRQPYALIDLSAGDYTVTTSHELIEMLVDPFGSRLHTAKAPAGWHGPARVQYLLEPCDPCEETAYLVGGVRVSDFLLPAYYRSSGRPGVAVTQAGGCTSPLEVAEGGYISWVDPVTGEWWQRFVQDGHTQDRALGQADASAASLREWVDEQARLYRAL